MKNPTIIEDITQLIACGISAISVWALLFAILRNSTVRSNTFNLYLVFSLVPDAVYFLWMLVFNSLSLVDDLNFYTIGDYGNLLGHVFWYLDIWCANFWVCASLWMSFSVFVQIYKLLTANKRAKRYQPPTRKRVIRDSTIILIISGIVAASITLWRVYYNEDSDRDDRILFWATTYIPALYIPTLLITGMCFGVWWSKLIPRKNARHCALTLFFVRLIASTYLVAIGSTIALSAQYWPNENSSCSTCLVFSKCV